MNLCFASFVDQRFIKKKNGEKEMKHDYQLNWVGVNMTNVDI